MARAAARTTQVIATEEIGSLNDLSAAFAWFHQLLPQTAEEELAKEQARGNLLDPVTFVDGKKSDNIAGVKIFGTIAYVSSAGPIQKVITALAAFVAQAAPHKTGHYRGSFLWLLNGQPMDGPPNAEQVGLKGNVMLLNMTPYASWLEVHVPTGILFAAYNSLKRAFGRTVSIAYGYANPDSFGGQAWRPGTKPGDHPFMVPYVLIGNPGSTVIPGATMRGKSGARKRVDKRAGRGHRQRRGIARGQKGPKK